MENTDSHRPNDTTRHAESLFDIGYLMILACIEIALLYKLGWSLWVLLYGFVCALRGGQLALMRQQGTWKKLGEILGVSRCVDSTTA